MKLFVSSSLALGCLLLVRTASAGTVITTDLPSNVQIVNIDATKDGIATYSNDPYQSFFYQPNSTAPSLTLPAGTYSFSIIDPADAAKAFPTLSAADLGKIYTAWTFNSPWTEDYLVFDSLAVANSTETQLFDGAIAPGLPNDQTFGTKQGAYDGTVADGYYDKIRLAPPGRAGTASDYATQFTLTQTTTLLFVIPDNFLGDNGGGVSVVVEAVPEPATSLALGAGGIVLILAARRRRQGKLTCTR